MKNIWRGFLLGLGSILPGVSGGTLAISMGIYDKLLEHAGNFFSHIKESVRYLFPIAVGMGVAMLAGVIGLEFLFERFELQANLLFIGLILGSFPKIYGKVRNVDLRPGYVICALVFFFGVVGSSLVHDVWGTEAVLEVGILPALQLFLVGIVAAATMVIPGVSGSMILLLLGYYKPILAQAEGILEAAFALRIADMVSFALLLLPFGLGLACGIVLVSKITLWLFEHLESYVYFAILGLLLATPIGIMSMGTYRSISFSGVLIGVILLMGGLYLSGKLGD